MAGLYHERGGGALTSLTLASSGVGVRLVTFTDSPFA
jgi:hypothetical protein